MPDRYITLTARRGQRYKRCTISLKAAGRRTSVAYRKMHNRLVICREQCQQMNHSRDAPFDGWVISTLAGRLAASSPSRSNTDRCIGIIGRRPACDRPTRYFIIIYLPTPEMYLHSFYFLSMIPLYALSSEQVCKNAGLELSRKDRSSGCG